MSLAPSGAPPEPQAAAGAFGGLSALSASAGPHVLVEDVAAPDLSDADRHHLERVLRVAPGEPLTVGDGAGRWRECLMGTPLEPVGEVRLEAAPSPALAVGFAVLKGGRSDHVVQKLTELGIDRIVPFTSQRCVARPDPSRAADLHERWRRVARQAVMQCGRAWLPRVERIRPFAEVVDPAAVGVGVALAVPGGRALQAGERCLLIGPEGGWEESELAAVHRHVGIGAHVLRSDTAAVAAGALLTARRSGLLHPRTHL